jgi:hypothetical protein
MLRLVSPLPTGRRALPVRAAVLALAGAAALLAFSPAHAGTPAFWAANGSSGIVDESGFNPIKFFFTNGGAFVKGSSSGPQSVTLRYPVSSMPDGISTPLVSPKVSVRYVDNSTAGEGAAQVLVTLKSLNITNGSSNVSEAVLDSNNFPAQDGSQMHVMDTCLVAWDFVNKTYYFEVTLTEDRSKNPNASAWLQQIRIDPATGCEN